jgi:glycosyltransferase involved in cell wall biosynthesis
MKHVLFVLPSLGIGGAQRHLIRYVEGLTARKYKVSLIVTGSENELESELPTGTGIHYLRIRTASPLLWASFLRTLKRVDADLVVGWSLYSNLLVGFFCLLGAIHNGVVVELNYPPIVLKNMPLMRSLVIRLSMRLFYKRARVVCANSNETLEILRNRLWVGSGPRYERIFNPVNLEAFRSESLANTSVPNHKEGKIILLAVGRMYNQHKGFDVLLHACAELLNCPYHWELWMVGGGVDLKMLKELACDLGIDNNIVWYGEQLNALPFYDMADIVILPSRHEGFPNVLLEAMVLGKATISSDCKSGPREMTVDGKFGILVPVNDEKKMADAILNLMSEPVLRKKLGESARDHIATAYSEEKVFSQLIHVINT